jgi:hypothetical protein
VPVPIARWNPARSVWETNETLICGHSDVWSETWPSSGTWADGQVYELPMSARLMDGSASSSSLGRLLATPTASIQTGGPPQDSRGKRDLRLDMVNLLPIPTTQDGANTAGPAQFDRNSLPLNAVATLLPTPTATPYGNNQSPSPGAAVRPSLDSLAPTLLPTPRATDGTKGGPNQRGSSGDLMLPSAVMLIPTPLASDAGPRGGTTGFGLRDWSRSIGASTEMPSDDGNAA